MTGIKWAIGETVLGTHCVILWAHLEEVLGCDGTSSET
jgi:hypothetical protein